MNAADLAAAVAQFQHQGGVIREVQPEERKQYRRRQPEHNPVLAEQLRKLAHLGVVAAARAMHLHTTTIHRIADHNGITFPTSTAGERQQRAKLRAGLAPRVRRMAGHMSQQQIAEALGTTRATIRRVAAENGININSRHQ